MQMNAENTSDLIEIPAQVQPEAINIPQTTRKPFKKSSRLNHNQKRMVNLLFSGHTIKQAAELCGYSENYGYNLVRKQKVINSFAELLEVEGVTDIALTSKIRDLLKAKKKIFTKRGVEEVDDNTTQFDTLKLTTQLKGHLVNKSQVEAPGIEDILREIMDRRK